MGTILLDNSMVRFGKMLMSKNCESALTRLILSHSASITMIKIEPNTAWSRDSADLMPCHLELVSANGSIHSEAPYI
jgi:hypothetical protein